MAVPTLCHSVAMSYYPRIPAFLVKTFATRRSPLLSMRSVLLTTISGSSGTVKLAKPAAAAAKPATKPAASASKPAAAKVRLGLVQATVHANHRDTEGTCN